MPQIVDTARGTANILPNRIKVEMHDKISLLKPRVYPLAVLLKKLATMSTGNYKYEWLEDDLMARWTSCVGGATNVATTVNVAVGTGGLIAVNDLIKVTSTNEIMKVTAVVADALTVQRGYGETTGTIIAADAKLLIMGNAMMQGSGATSEKYTNTVPAFNYTQIFKTPFSVTNTLNATKLYGGKEKARLRMKKAIEHMQSIEYALLFGERKLDLTGAQPTTTTGGVTRFLAGTANVGSISKGLTKDQQIAALDAYMETLFTYGSDKKIALCSADVLTWLSSLVIEKLRVNNADANKTLGLNFTEYQTVHGTLQLIQHPLLVEGYASTALILDLEELAYRPLEGRDTKLMTNIQDNDEDGERDMFITEAGLELKQAKKHGWLTLTA